MCVTVTGHDGAGVCVGGLAQLVHPEPVKNWESLVFCAEVRYLGSLSLAGYPLRFRA